MTAPQQSPSTHNTYSVTSSPVNNSAKTIITVKEYKTLSTNTHAHLYQQVVDRVSKAQAVICGNKPARALPDKYNHDCNMKRLERIKRISGLYAASFFELEKLGIYIPFVGTAAFASNVVRWNVEETMYYLDILTGYSEEPPQSSDNDEDWSFSFPRMIPLPFPFIPVLLKIYDREVSEEALKRGYDPKDLLVNPDDIQEYVAEKVRRKLDTITSDINSILNQVFAGNYLVFMEIFPIIDFTIRYVKETGTPKTQEEIKELRHTLDRFVEYWRSAVQPFGEVKELMQQYEGSFKVDRSQLIREGIELCLSGRSLRGSRDRILYNEQRYTLQDYMWEKMFEGKAPLEFVTNTKLAWLDGDMKYSYNKKDSVPDNFLLEFKGDGSITNPDIRYPFTQKVVQRYDALYSGGKKVQLITHLNRLAKDATNF